MSMTKRVFDLTVATLCLVALSPLLLALSFAIWITDFRSPLYVAPRTGRGNSTFKMVKFRSMRAGADHTGVDSTAANDRRITPIGSFLRAYKLDEIPQLW